MTISECILHETCCALQDAQDIIRERGNDIIIYKNNESEIERDIYGSIKKRTQVQYNFKAFPIDYNPTQDILEKAGIKENVDVLVTTASQDWTENSINFNDIDGIRWEVELNGELFTIAEKNRINMFGNVYLNYILGLFKK
jgi:hypothetical protein